MAWHGQELRIRRSVSHVLNDLGHGEFETIIGCDVRPEHDDEEVDFPVAQHRPENLPVDTFIVGLALGLDSPSGHLT